MKKLYFLGSGANYKNIWKHVFSHGTKKDIDRLEDYLSKRYSGKAITTKNGRTALYFALKTYLRPGDEVIVNGFTCYAVVEALKAAKIKPIYADISKDDLNFTSETIEKAIRGKNPRAIIVQNSLGNVVDIQTIEKLAKKYNLLIIEDLAHSAGAKYADGREAGTVGIATALSFGKEKSIDTISGGAVILRGAGLNEARPEIPVKRAQVSDTLRARFYPLLGAITRGLAHVRLNGLFMGILLKIHWVEKSADNRLDASRRISKFEAKLALEQLEALKPSSERKLRSFYLVDNRDEVLKELKASGYYFNGIWYERPISPERYYKKAHFPEEDCPVAVFVAEHIVNMPNYYTKKELLPAYSIIKKHILSEPSAKERTNG